MNSFRDPANEPWGGAYAYSGNDVNGGVIKASRVAKGGVNKFSTQFTVLDDIEKTGHCTLDALSFNNGFL